MASIEVRDTIESSGFPLAFRVDRDSDPNSSVDRNESSGPAFIKVEARALGGHQKEAVVTEGALGTAWRMVSDEGPILQGTDLAPFPLGFMNAGMQADVLGRLAALARQQGIAFDGATSELATDYTFEGSFFKGTGKGSATAPVFGFGRPAQLDPAVFNALIQRALAGSPLIAMHGQELTNSFALHVNGKRRALSAMLESREQSVQDPLKSWAGIPSPGRAESLRPQASGSTNLIERLPQPASGVSGTASPTLSGESAKIDIMVRGRARSDQSTTRSEVWLARPVGSHFSLSSCESLDHRPAASAPLGLSLAMAGIAFCLMTQILRYVGYHKMNVRALRVVQISPFEWAADGQAKALPLDTHVFVHADERDDTMERLLVMAANTCYLHAALGSALETKVTQL